MSRKKRSNIKRPESRQSRFQLRMIMVIACFTVIMVFYNRHQVNEQIERYEQQEAKIQTEIEAEKQKRKELEKEQEYMGTDAFKEEYARKNLDMIKKGEKILKERVK